MRHLDLFSGIGGFALAARRVGWETAAFCENDKWCQDVLKKHWPDVPVYSDVRKLYRFADEYIPCPDCEEPYCELCEAHFAECECTGCSEFDDEIGEIDIITAGWPCQDLSVAGKGAGLAGERSGLFYDVARIIRALRPRYAVLENVSALLARGMGDVVGKLVEIGYDCEWHCIPASAVGAPHRRDRIWIIAYPFGHAPRHESGRRRGPIGTDPGCQFLEGWQPQGPTDRSELWGHAGWWATEPDVGRVANGVPRRVDRLRGLGNSIVPQVAEAIFRSLKC